MSQESLLLLLIFTFDDDDDDSGDYHSCRLLSTRPCGKGCTRNVLKESVTDSSPLNEVATAITTPVILERRDQRLIIKVQ